VRRRIDFNVVDHALFPSDFFAIYAADRGNKSHRTKANEQNPKSEYRNPKQTHGQTNLKPGKSKTPNPKEACLEFYLFWSFEIVSNFGFRASTFVVDALRETQFFRSTKLINSEQSL
jgi:hypothetical protein